MEDYTSGSCAVEDYTKWELSGGGSPRLLDISNWFIVAVHFTYQHMLCLLLLLTVHHIDYKIVRIYHILLPIHIAQKNSYQPSCRCFGRELIMASFGLSKQLTKSMKSTNQIAAIIIRF